MASTSQHQKFKATYYKIQILLNSKVEYIFKISADGIITSFKSVKE